MTRSDRIKMTIVSVIGIVWILFEHNTQRASLIFLGGLWIESGFFCTIYYFRSNWRATAAGRSMMWVVFSLWTLVTWLFAQWIFKDAIPYRNTLRNVLYLTLMLAYFRLNLVLRRVQRGDLSRTR